MGSLTQKKLSWIIREKRRGKMTTADIALAIELSVPYVKKIWAKYRDLNNPVLAVGKPSRPGRGKYGRRKESAVAAAYCTYRRGARLIADILAYEDQIDISHRAVRYIMLSMELEEQVAHSIRR